jgi:hypothetical protein
MTKPSEDHKWGHPEPGHVWHKGNEFRKIDTTAEQAGDRAMVISWLEFERGKSRSCILSEWMEWVADAIRVHPPVPVAPPELLEVTAAVVYDAENDDWMVFGGKNMTPSQAAASLRDNDDFDGELIGIVTAKIPLPAKREIPVVEA